MSELELLLEELKKMQHTVITKNITNSKDVWKHLFAHDWTGAGFDNESQAKDWMNQNEYSENLN